MKGWIARDVQEDAIWMSSISLWLFKHSIPKNDSTQLERSIRETQLHRERIIASGRDNIERRPDYIAAKVKTWQKQYRILQPSRTWMNTKLSVCFIDMVYNERTGNWFSQQWTEWMSRDSQSGKKQVVWRGKKPKVRDAEEEMDQAQKKLEYVLEKQEQEPSWESFSIHNSASKKDRSHVSWTPPGNMWLVFLLPVAIQGFLTLRDTRMGSTRGEREEKRIEQILESWQKIWAKTFVSPLAFVETHRQIRTSRCTSE